MTRSFYLSITMHFALPSAVTGLHGCTPIARVILAIAVVAACLSDVSLAEIRLDQGSNIDVREQGDFGTASGRLKELLERNLLLILRKESLDGPGDRVEFVLETEASRWQELPPASRERLTQIDSFTVDVRPLPAPRVAIRGKTPVATGYGVLCFLEEQLGMHWAFPGELGRCLPKSEAFVLREGTIEREPSVVGRALSGMLLRDDATPDPGDRRSDGVLMENREFFLSSDYFKKSADAVRIGHPQHAPHLPDRNVPEEPSGNTPKTS